MSENEQQLERIFTKLDNLSKGQAGLDTKLGVIGERLGAHIEGSVKYRDKVDAHDQFITRAKTVGSIFAGVWTLALGWMWKKIVGA
jgi:hypothetical protein